MKTLEQQLADYGGRQRQLHGPIDPDELVARRSLVASVDGALNPGEAKAGVPLFDYLRQEPFDRADPPRRNRWSGVVGAVAATILVVVGVVVVADEDNGDVATDPASTPGVSVPAAPRGVADPVPPLWPLTFRDQAVRSEMSGVVAWGPGFVAVGSQAVCTDQEVDGKEDLGTCDGEDQNAAVWTSVDGISWSRVAHDEAVFGESGMVDVAVGGPGLVAVGSAVWTSVDGLTWLRVPHDEAAFGGGWIHSVTVGGPGLVAVGTAEASFGDGEHNDDAAVWTSSDGLTWSRVPHDETTFGGADNQSMWSVTAGGPGLVAVGRDGQGPWDNSRGQDAAVWTSVDGLTWSRVPHDEDVFGGGSPTMFSVTAEGPGLVAVGFTTRNWSAAVWTSIDGLAWSRVAHDNGVDLSGTMRSVTAGGPGLIAVGAAAVWTSPDGLTWSLAANGGEAEPRTYSKMLDVSAANGRLVAVGRLDRRSTPGPDLPHEEPAAVWTSPNPLLTPEN